MSDSTQAVLTHVDASGAARMVDVSGKSITKRRAVASGRVDMRPATLDLITSGRVPKGDVLAVARLAAVMAAKRTSDLIPLCHPLPIDAVRLDFTPDPGGRLDIEAEVTVEGKTGVEMEAMVAVSAAALTVYDMCKAVDRGMAIGGVRLEAKSGGRSGEYRRAVTDQ
jgi:cyclic pyranopterin monophosphate synthase